MTSFVVPTVEEVISSRKSEYGYSEYRFPDDLGPHSIILNFSDYNFDRNADKVSTVIKSSICLPIPKNLRDTFSLRMTAESIGTIGNMTRDIVGGVISSNNAESALQNVISSDSWKEGILGNLVKSAVASTDSSIIKGIESATGTIINPHLTLTFDGVDLKTHSFDWTFAPQSSSESVRLAKIIRTIKSSVLPTYDKTAGRTFLKYPKVVDVFFMGTEPGHLYFFKRCMVSKFDTDFAGAGMPAFLPGGRPAFVNITMELYEMEIHTAEDYGD